MFERLRLGGVFFCGDCLLYSGGACPYHTLQDCEKGGVEAADRQQHSEKTGRCGGFGKRDLYLNIVSLCSLYTWVVGNIVDFEC